MDEKNILLDPRNGGENCPGNGKHLDENGEIIECMCDECDYLMDCTDIHALYLSDENK